MRLGVRFGIDVGKSRIGVARSDHEGILAVPVETVARDDRAVARISALVEEYEAFEVYVGLPLNLRGDHTPSTDDALAFASELAESLQSTRSLATVRLTDERLSTVSASRSLREVGRTVKKSRTIIDQAAAVVILQAALEHERSRGAVPGEPVNADRGANDG